jgi:hypothetical protein
MGALKRCTWSALSAGLLLAGTTGCEPVDPAPEPQASEVHTHDQELVARNGLSVNGLSVNGLSVNGLSVNGLSVNGLASAEFDNWFQQDPALRDMVMRYVVRCAVPVGETRQYTDPKTGTTYTWYGLLGLAPDWASGRTATEAEQQVVSACLAAHANKAGVQMFIAVLGRDARGRAIPSSWSELATYSKREACFFGNLFTDEGLYVGHDQGLLAGGESSLRGCALSSGLLHGMEAACPPLVPIGDCELFCTRDLSLNHYTSCTYNGRTFRPITTRLRPSDVYHCGDGICQSTESCGYGVSYDSCSLDCGFCR